MWVSRLMSGSAASIARHDYHFRAGVYKARD